MTHAQATASDRSIGDYIRDWRQHRRFSQLALALEIELSQKHLSFIESGRSSPSREVVLRIAAGLGVPLRIRNLMLLAASRGCSRRWNGRRPWLVHGSWRRPYPVAASVQLPLR